MAYLTHKVIQNDLSLVLRIGMRFEASALLLILFRYFLLNYVIIIVFAAFFYYFLLLVYDHYFIAVHAAMGVTWYTLDHDHRFVSYFGSFRCQAVILMCFSYAPIII